MSGKFSGFYRVVAAVTLFCFTSQTASANSLPFNLSDTSTKSAFLILNAHTSSDAQKNISELLESFSSQGIDLIGLEGADQHIDGKDFRNFDNHEALSTAAWKMVKEGYFSGAEYYYITAPKVPHFFGLEDKALYLKNKEAFINTTHHKEALHDVLNQLHGTVLTLKKKTYSKNLYAFDEKVGRYESHDVSYLEHLNVLLEASRKNRINLPGFPNLYSLSKSIEGEQKISQKKLKKELDQIQNAFRHREEARRGDVAISEIASGTACPRNDLACYQKIHGYFELLIKEGAFNPNQYSHFSAYYEWLSAFVALEPKQLFSEMDELTNLIYTRLTKSKEESSLIRFSKSFGLFNKLISLELTPKEWHEAKKGIDLSSLSQNPALTQARKNAERFYELAEERNKVFADRISSEMKRKHKNQSVVVIGGFHEEGVKEALKEKGIRTEVISPKIGKALSDIPYLDRMMGKPSELEKELFTPESTLALESLISEIAPRSERQKAHRFLHLLISGERPETRNDEANEPTRHAYNRIVGDDTEQPKTWETVVMAALAVGVVIFGIVVGMMRHADSNKGTTDSEVEPAASTLRPESRDPKLERERERLKVLIQPIVKGFQDRRSYRWIGAWTIKGFSATKSKISEKLAEQAVIEERKLIRTDRFGTRPEVHRYMGLLKTEPITLEELTLEVMALEQVAEEHVFGIEYFKPFEDRTRVALDAEEDPALTYEYGPSFKYEVAASPARFEFTLNPPAPTILYPIFNPSTAGRAELRDDILSALMIGGVALLSILGTLAIVTLRRRMIERKAAHLLVQRHDYEHRFPKATERLFKLISDYVSTTPNFRGYQLQLPISWERVPERLLADLEARIERGEMFGISLEKHSKKHAPVTVWAREAMAHRHKNAVTLDQKLALLHEGMEYYSISITRPELRVYQDKNLGLDIYEVTDQNSGSSFKVVPALGAKMISLIVNGREIFWQPEDLTQRGGNPFMFPYANRIEGGKFTIEDTTVDVNSHANWFDGNRTPLHGFAADLPWKYDGSWTTYYSGNGNNGVYLKLSLDFKDHPEQVPAYYRNLKVSLIYHLSGGKLRVITQVFNDDFKRPTNPVAVSWGFHPFFLTPNRDEWQVQLPAHYYWATDSSLIPYLQGPSITHDKYDLWNPTSLRSLELDDVFTGLDGTVRLFNFKSGISIDITQENYPHAVLWLPTDDGKARDYLGLEQQTSATNSMNMLDIAEATPVLIQGGDTVRSSVTYDIQGRAEIRLEEAMYFLATLGVVFFVLRRLFKISISPKAVPQRTEIKAEIERNVEAALYLLPENIPDVQEIRRTISYGLEQLNAGSVNNFRSFVQRAKLDLEAEELKDVISADILDSAGKFLDRAVELISDFRRAESRDNDRIDEYMLKIKKGERIPLRTGVDIEMHLFVPEKNPLEDDEDYGANRGKPYHPENGAEKLVGIKVWMEGEKAAYSGKTFNRLVDRARQNDADVTGIPALQKNALMEDGSVMLIFSAGTDAIIGRSVTKFNNIVLTLTSFSEDEAVLEVSEPRAETRDDGEDEVTEEQVRLFPADWDPKDVEAKNQSGYPQSGHVYPFGNHFPSAVDQLITEIAATRGYGTDYTILIHYNDAVIAAAEVKGSFVTESPRRTAGETVYGALRGQFPPGTLLSVLREAKQNPKLQGVDLRIVRAEVRKAKTEKAAEQSKPVAPEIAKKKMESIRTSVGEIANNSSALLYREREILKLRYGLGATSEPATIESIVKTFKFDKKDKVYTYINRALRKVTPLLNMKGATIRAALQGDEVRFAAALSKELVETKPVLPRVKPRSTAAWKSLTRDFQRVKNFHLRHLLTNTRRTQRFTTEFDFVEGNRTDRQINNFLVDYSKNRIDPETMDHLLGLARQTGLPKAIELMFTGAKINETEDRAVLHTALRAPPEADIYVDGENVVPKVHAVLARMKEISDQINSGEWKGYDGDKITDVVNIGIGGSDLGPVMVTQALQHYKTGNVNVHFVSNVDGTDIYEKVISKLNPKTTLFLIASKTFTTQETMTNAQTARQWFLNEAQDPEAIKKHFIALSTNKVKVEEFGIAPENMLEFWDWVGGRYSLWSAIGLSIAIYIGFDNFKQLLAGAHEMDRHFRRAPFDKNIPVILALLEIWYTNFYKAETHAILPYDQYLHRLPAYLQQAFMESNGKGTTREGKKLNYIGSPIIWGEAGTNGQHSFYQLIHQGHQLIPADFIAFRENLTNVPGHHPKLTSNVIAQPEALALGQTLKEVLAAGVSALLAPHMVFPGHNPSTVISIDQLTPASLGALIAMYEHQIFATGVILNLFSFDQFGVELGKKKSGVILPELLGEKPKAGVRHDSSTKQLIQRHRRRAETRLIQEAVSQLRAPDFSIYQVHSDSPAQRLATLIIRESSEAQKAFSAMESLLANPTLTHDAYLDLLGTLATVRFFAHDASIRQRALNLFISFMTQHSPEFLKQALHHVGMTPYGSRHVDAIFQGILLSNKSHQDDRYELLRAENFNEFVKTVLINNQNPEAIRFILTILSAISERTWKSDFFADDQLRKDAKTAVFRIIAQHLDNDQIWNSVAAPFIREIATVRNYLHGLQDGGNNTASAIMSKYDEFRPRAETRMQQPITFDYVMTSGNAGIVHYTTTNAARLVRAAHEFLISSSKKTFTEAEMFDLARKNPFFITGTQITPNANGTYSIKSQLKQFVAPRENAKNNNQLLVDLIAKLGTIDAQIKAQSGNGEGVKQIVHAGQGGSSATGNALDLPELYIWDGTDSAALNALLLKLAGLTPRQKAQLKTKFREIIPNLLVVPTAFGMTSEEAVIYFATLYSIAEEYGLAENFKNQVWSLTFPGSSVDNAMRARGFGDNIMQQLDGTNPGRGAGPVATPIALYPLYFNALKQGKDPLEVLSDWNDFANLNVSALRTFEILAILLDQHVNAGRNKVTLVLPPKWQRFEEWIKQIFEESEGVDRKKVYNQFLGKGTLVREQEPELKIITNEQNLDPRYYQSFGESDRVFLVLQVAGEDLTKTQQENLEKLKVAGHPVITLNVPGTDYLPSVMQGFHYTVATLIGYFWKRNFVTQPSVENYKAVAKQMIIEAMVKGGFLKNSEAAKDSAVYFDALIRWFLRADTNNARIEESDTYQEVYGERAQATFGDQNGRLRIYMQPGADVPTNLDGAEFVAELINAAQNKLDQHGLRPMAEIAHGGDLDHSVDGKEMAKLLDGMATDLFRVPFKVAVDITSVPKHLHSTHEAIRNQDGLTILLVPEQYEAPFLGRYSSDYIKAQVMAARQALEEVGRTVIMITYPANNKKGRALLNRFKKEVESYLRAETRNVEQLRRLERHWKQAVHIGFRQRATKLGTQIQSLRRKIRIQNSRLAFDKQPESDQESLLPAAFVLSREGYLLLLTSPALVTGASLTRSVNALRQRRAMLRAETRSYGIHDVLVVDDSKIFQRLGHRYIEGWGTINSIPGLNIRVVSSGEEALTLYDQSPFDVVLMDVNMSGKNGTTLAREIHNRKNGKSVPHILLWSDSRTEQDAEVQSLIEQGIISQFIVKDQAAEQLPVALKRINQLFFQESAAETLARAGSAPKISDVKWNDKVNISRDSEKVLTIRINNETLILPTSQALEIDMSKPDAQELLHQSPAGHLSSFLLARFRIYVEPIAIANNSGNGYKVRIGHHHIFLNDPQHDALLKTALVRALETRAETRQEEEAAAKATELIGEYLTLDQTGFGKGDSAESGHRFTELKEEIRTFYKTNPFGKATIDTLLRAIIQAYENHRKELPVNEDDLAVIHLLDEHGVFEPETIVNQRTHSRALGLKELVKEAVYTMNLTESPKRPETRNSEIQLEQGEQILLGSAIKIILTELDAKHASVKIEAPRAIDVFDQADAKQESTEIPGTLLNEWTLPLRSDTTFKIGNFLVVTIANFRNAFAETEAPATADFNITHPDTLDVKKQTRQEASAFQPITPHTVLGILDQVKIDGMIYEVSGISPKNERVWLSAPGRKIRFTRDELNGKMFRSHRSFSVRPEARTAGQSENLFDLDFIEQGLLFLNEEHAAKLEISKRPFTRLADFREFLGSLEAQGLRTQLQQIHHLENYRNEIISRNAKNEKIRRVIRTVLYELKRTHRFTFVRIDYQKPAGWFGWSLSPTEQPALANHISIQIPAENVLGEPTARKVLEQIAEKNPLNVIKFTPGSVINQGGGYYQLTFTGKPLASRPETREGPIKILFADNPKEIATIERVREAMGQFFGNQVEVISEHGMGGTKDEWRKLRSAIEREKPAIVMVRSDTTVSKEAEFMEFAEANGVLAFVRMGAGYDNINEVAAKDHHISVARTHGNANSVGDLAARFVLGALELFGKVEPVSSESDLSSDAEWQKVFMPLDDVLDAYRKSVKDGRGETLTMEQFMQMLRKRDSTQADQIFKLLEGKVVAISGLGQTAQRFAHKLNQIKDRTKTSFQIMATTRHLDRGREREVEIAERLDLLHPGFDTILENAFLWSLHLPANADTKDYLKLEHIQRATNLKIIINTSRQDVIAADALEEFLSRGGLYFADIDLAKGGKPFTELKKLIEKYPNQFFATPHIAANTANAAKGVEENTVPTLRDIVERLLGLQSSSDFEAEIVNETPIPAVFRAETRMSRPAPPDVSLITHPDQPLHKQLARWVANPNIPQESLDEAKRRILDSLAIGARAKNYLLGRARMEQALRLAVSNIPRAHSPKDYATVFFTKKKTPIREAALLLGVLIRDLDFDDTILGQEPGHPSDNIAPILLLGEALGKSGKEILEAIVVAYEIQIRFAEALKLRDNGWDHVAYLVISVAMGIGKLLDLNEEQLAQVAARATMTAGLPRGMRQKELSDMKSGNAAWAASLGLQAALDVRDGLGGPEHPFETKYGFNEQFLDNLDFRRYIEPFDGRAIFKSFYKRRQAEYHAQSAIEVAQELHRQMKGRLSGKYGASTIVNEDGSLTDEALRMIKSIDLHTFEAVVTILTDKSRTPKNRESADHNMPYMIAAALVFGDVDERTFQKEIMEDRRVLKLSEMIKIQEDTAYTAAYYDPARRHNHNRIKVTMDSGIEFEEDLENASGHWSRPWGNKEVSEKVHRLLDPMYGSRRVQTMINTVLDMDGAGHRRPFNTERLLRMFANPDEDSLITEGPAIPVRAENRRPFTIEVMEEEVAEFLKNEHAATIHVIPGDTYTFLKKHAATIHVIPGNTYIISQYSIYNSFEPKQRARLFAGTVFHEIKVRNLSYQSLIFSKSVENGKVTLEITPSSERPETRELIRINQNVNPQPKAVLFDFDGTLSHTLETQYQAFGRLHHWIVAGDDDPNPSAEELRPGRAFLDATMGQLASTQIHKMMDLGKQNDVTEDRWRHILHELAFFYQVEKQIEPLLAPGKGFDDFIFAFSIIYEAYLILEVEKNPPQPLSGILSLIRALHEADVPFYVGTGTIARVAAKILETWGVRPLFQDVYGTVVDRPSPFPRGKADMLEHIAKIHQLSKNQVVIFGDGTSDVSASWFQGSQEAGKNQEKFVAVGITNNNSNLADRLVAAGADFLIPSLENWESYWQLLNFPARPEARKIQNIVLPKKPEPQTPIRSVIPEAHEDAFAEERLRQGLPALTMDDKTRAENRTQAVLLEPEQTVNIGALRVETGSFVPVDLAKANLQTNINLFADLIGNQKNENVHQFIRVTREDLDNLKDITASDTVQFLTALLLSAKTGAKVSLAVEQPDYQRELNQVLDRFFSQKNARQFRKSVTAVYVPGPDVVNGQYKNIATAATTMGQHVQVLTHLAEAEVISGRVPNANITASDYAIKNGRPEFINQNSLLRNAAILWQLILKPADSISISGKVHMVEMSALGEFAEDLMALRAETRQLLSAA